MESVYEETKFMKKETIFLLLLL